MSKHSYSERYFYCMNCGQKSMPIIRKNCLLKEKFHRKKLYCYHCGKDVNHVECRNPEEIEEFMRKFEAGEFKEEAEQSMEHCEKVVL